MADKSSDPSATYISSDRADAWQRDRRTNKGKPAGDSAISAATVMDAITSLRDRLDGNPLP